MSVNQEQIDLLKNFVQICQSNPAILHMTQLNFYREWIESMGGKIPDVAESKPSGSFESGDAAFNTKSTEHSEESPMDETPAPEETKEEESESGTESELELDNEGVIECENDPPLEMGDSSLEVTEEMCDQSSEKRSEAMNAMNEDRLSDSVDLYTEAIKLNPQSAVLFAKRASVLIRMQKPNLAIADCERAIQLNPDSAQAYKWRGKARRLIGDWVGAYNDLNTSNRMDYDESVVELLHQVEGNAKRILEHRRRYEREHNERELKHRRERARKAREEHEKAKRASESDGTSSGGMPGGFPGGMPGGFPGGMPGGSGGMPDIGSLLSDPELMAAFQDPEVMEAFNDVSKHPGNISKYESNPKIKSVIEKMTKKFAGAGAGSEQHPCGGGAEGSCGGSCA